ncbi:MAG: D-alanyl-D-alanine carboxypeptidase [Rhodomicrobium sp.]|nr:D-alanyl-D-alanine carboxypeptidase [Rhodomicrobium sp.]
MNCFRLLLTVLAAPFLALASVPVQAGPAIVIEPDTGLVIYSEDADRLWHPASLTKLMTAFITFEELRDGKLAAADKVTCSEHALSQPPSKIGLPVGGEMTVELALKALIVKSANDVAVMMAERISGSEAAFVERMNATAKRLGMTRTTFFNANGLPHDGQVTTARDMAILGQALLKEFPGHADLYAMPSFKIGKRTLRSHNGLLRVFEGANGMKTGFICASGFNVVASAKRDDLSILAVVLGEQSGGARTARAAQLIQHGFDFYGWKQMFSAKLDQIGVDQSASEAPVDMRGIVCKPRPAKKRKRSKPKTAKKPKTQEG